MEGKERSSPRHRCTVCQVRIGLRPEPVGAWDVAHRAACSVGTWDVRIALWLVPVDSRNVVPCGRAPARAGNVPGCSAACAACERACQSSPLLQMSVIRTNAAAALLGVSSNTLRSWESRFGYPKPQRTEGGHRQFDLAEIEALRQTYAETQDIASAISVARERGEGPSTPTRLSAAFSEFGEEKADRLMEESMAVRSVERTVEMVLLPAVEAMSPDDPMLSRAPKPLSDGAEPGKGPASSPEYCFAWRYATGWLAPPSVWRHHPPAMRVS